MSVTPKGETAQPNAISAGDDIYHRLRWSNILTDLHRRFVQTYGIHHDIHHFRWQSTFRDRLIRDEEDGLNHLEHINHNAMKRGLTTGPEQYPWMGIRGMKPPLIPD